MNDTRQSYANTLHPCAHKRQLHPSMAIAPTRQPGASGAGAVAAGANWLQLAVLFDMAMCTPQATSSAGTGTRSTLGLSMWHPRPSGEPTWLAACFCFFSGGRRWSPPHSRAGPAWCDCRGCFDSETRGLPAMPAARASRHLVSFLLSSMPAGLLLALRVVGCR